MASARAMWAVMFLATTAPAMAQSVIVHNSLHDDRARETIELPWAEVVKLLPAARAERVLVTDDTGKSLEVQPVHADNGKAFASLLFQADFKADQTRSFTLSTGKPPAYVPKVYGRWIPERLDDFAWESDRIAFRVYGPALEKVEPASSGIDVWVKRTPRLVVDEWYQLAQSIDGGYYHVDHGDGCDCYKTGHGQGCGGTSLWADGKRLTTGTAGWVQQHVLANGPLRVSFELTIAPVVVNGAAVVETKHVSLDAGSNFNHLQSTFNGGVEGAALTVAVGVMEHTDRPFEKTLMPTQNWMSYWDAGDKSAGVENGHIGTAAVFHPGQVALMLDADGHLLALIPANLGVPIDYYAGAGWDKSGQFPDKATWDAAVAAEARRVAAPLQVRFSASKEGS